MLNTIRERRSLSKRNGPYAELSGLKGVKPAPPNPDPPATQDEPRDQPDAQNQHSGFSRF